MEIYEDKNSESYYGTLGECWDENNGNGDGDGVANGNGFLLGHGIGRGTGDGGGSIMNKSGKG